MNRKLLTLSLFCLLTPETGFSQGNYKNGLFLELGGNGYYGSINYERTNSKGVNARIGFFCLNPKDLMILPVTVGKVFGAGKHHFEIAGGFVFARNAAILNLTEKFIYLTGFVGYRYQVINKRFFLELDSHHFGSCTIILSMRLQDRSILGVELVVDLGFD